MKKLAVAIMLGIGVMVSGCGSQQSVQNTTTQSQQTQIITLNNVNIDKPQLSVGNTVNFHNVTPKMQNLTTVNGRKIVNETYGGKNGVTMYMIDITEVTDVERDKVAFVVDTVTTVIQNAQTFKLTGYYTGTDENVVITTVIGHAKVIK